MVGLVGLVLVGLVLVGLVLVGLVLVGLVLVGLVFGQCAKFAALPGGRKAAADPPGFRIIIRLENALGE